VQQFWLFLLYLETSAIGAYTVVGDHVVYGGNALQAFLVALVDHGRMIWDNGSPF